MNRYIPPPEDCPNCGKKNGAVQGSTQWGHSILCCSDKCGQEIYNKLQKNMKSKKYNDAEKMFLKYKKLLEQEKYRGINAREFSDQRQY